MLSTNNNFKSRQYTKPARITTMVMATGSADLSSGLDMGDSVNYQERGYMFQMVRVKMQNSQQ